MRALTVCELAWFWYACDDLLERGYMETSSTDCSEDRDGHAGSEENKL